MSSDSPLLTPFTLGNTLSLNNRVVMAPLTRARSGKDRIPTPTMAEYYRQRASAGLIISEATVISTQGIGWVESPGIYNDSQQQGWQQVVEAVHAAGGKIFMQLWHCGRASHSRFHDGELPLAPSAIKLNGDGILTPDGTMPYETPRPMTIEDIQQTVEDYRQATARAMQAGFDGIEIHAANGYLLDQFLQSRTNQREDDYGGSIENRYRLLDEVVRAVLQEVPSERLGVRLAPNGIFNDMGSEDYRETFLYATEQLNQHKLCYLHVVDGLAFGFHELGNPVMLAEFRPLFDGALMGNCGYTQASAEQAISTGDADLIAFGRPYLSNPDLVERFQNDWPLAPEADPEDWYTPSEKGYVDFPPYKPD